VIWDAKISGVQSIPGTRTVGVIESPPNRRCGRAEWD
jgi:hypothetical protein